MATYEQTLEQYITSSDFEDGVVSATKASWGGGGYTVELLPDGTWQNHWNSQIGNLYETPGILLGLPTLSEESTNDVDEIEVAAHDEALREIYQDEYDDLVKELKDTLHDRLVMIEASNG